MVQPASEGYQRIISMDYCADQYVLALAEREEILALSPDADKTFSYLRDQADGIPQIRPVAESVLAAQPDLIVRSYGGGPLAPRFFSQAGIDVLQIGWTSDFESIRTVTRDIAAQMGVPERGEELIAAFDARLAAITPRDDDQNVLYVTPGGVTSGPNGLINDAFETAGLTNYETRAGWHDLPLEQIATDAPDVGEVLLEAGIRALEQVVVAVHVGCRVHDHAFPRRWHIVNCFPGPKTDSSKTVTG